MIRIAVIGAGGYAGFLIDRLLELPERYQVVALVSRRGPEEARVAACMEKGAQVYATADAMWQSINTGNCDAVMVPTGIDTHFLYTSKALEQGFHVLLEKPPVPTIQELDELMELQKKAGKSIAVGFQFLYIESAQKPKQLLTSGALGEIRRVRSMAAWPRAVEYWQRSNWAGKLRMQDDWVMDGTIGNPLAHMMAQSLFFATAEPGLATPTSVQAELYHGHDIESEDTSSVRISTKGGVPVFFHATFAVDRQCDVMIEVEAENGTIRQIDFGNTTVHWRDGREEKIASANPSKNEQDKIDRHVMLNMIADAIEQGKRQPFDLEACRPYMLAWNGAFESNGLPREIPAELKRMVEKDGKTFIAPEGLSDKIEAASQEGKLFSEMGIPWAKPSQPFDVTSYRHFPTNPDFASIAGK